VKLKIVIMKLKNIFKKSPWRLKATNRTKELKALKKREKELITSRNNVKAKNNDLRLKIKELEKENTKLKYELKKK
jgi:predicted nuclease with TOPRIM domain